MKLRYFLLPCIIVSLMLLIINYDNNIINKEVFDEDKEINYPFFNNSNIDTYINNYLNDYINIDNILLDYDCTYSRGKYYLSFYRYISNNGMIINEKDNFIISNNTISKTSFDFEYDFITSNIVSSNKKYIALTFDDGPNYNTNKILDILEKNNVTASFFVLGSRIKGNEYILKRMTNSGMEIGNHTYNHLLLTKYSEDKVREEINSTKNLIFETTGKYPKLLRPSYGSINKIIKKEAGSPIIIWDIDTLDWKYHDSKRISSRVINKVKDGDIILMHDIYSATANALDIIIPKLKEMGYTFVTVSDLFYYKGITLEDGKVYGFAR